MLKVVKSSWPALAQPFKLQTNYSKIEVSLNTHKLTLITGGRIMVFSSSIASIGAGAVHNRCKPE